MSTTSPAATASETLHSYQCRTSCGHVVVRKMSAQTAGVAWTADVVLATPGGMACVSCRARRAHVPLCASGCDFCAGARSAALTGEGQIVAGPNGSSMWQAPSAVEV